MAYAPDDELGSDATTTQRELFVDRSCSETRRELPGTVPDHLTYSPAAAVDGARTTGAATLECDAAVAGAMPNRVVTTTNIAPHRRRRTCVFNAPPIRDATGALWCHVRPMPSHPCWTDPFNGFPGSVPASLSVVNGQFGGGSNWPGRHNPLRGAPPDQARSWCEVASTHAG